jgi:hypothetical protein
MSCTIGVVRRSASRPRVVGPALSQNTQIKKAFRAQSFLSPPPTLSPAQNQVTKISNTELP